jgi:hypothetical protein
MLFSFRFFFLLGIALFVAGCADSTEVGPVVPVTGHVFIDGEPMPGGAVNFNPDLSKGNDLRFIPSGRIQPDGSYTANTGNKVGAPPGWYKVTILANLPGSPSVPVNVDPRYTKADTTPFSVQVIDNPAADAYDLKMTE